MNDIAKLFLLAVAAALIIALIIALYMIGAETLQTVALVIGGAVALALVIGASALPIRAYRRRDLTGETHHYHDGTKTVVREVKVIDGRQVTSPEVKLLQLPAQPQGGAWPELLRAAYAAGVGALPGPGQAAVPDRDLAELDLTGGGGDPDGWGGEIVP